MWHLRRCSSPTASAPEGPDLVTQAHMGSPSCNSINDHPEPRLLGVRGGDIDQPDIMLDLLKLGPDLAHHTGPPAVPLMLQTHTPALQELPTSTWRRVRGKHLDTY